jgi:glycosyltransferase involved in cell wall biosynthesis
VLTDRLAQPLELVSVITPCYNGESFLAETISAVAAQTYPLIEHIVVDDGSTDGTWQILEAHRNRVIPIRSPENRGGAHARNVGVERARGAFLMFLDADDLIAPGAIAALVSAIGQQPGTIGFCAWKRLRQLDEQWRRFPAEIGLPAPDADPLRGWLHGIWVPPCAVLWRRDVFDAIGGWDETLTLNDDGELMMRALARGTRLVKADGGEAYYRDHGARLTVSNDLGSERKFCSRMQSYQKVVAELELQNRLHEYAMSLGLIFHELALIAFREGYPIRARECAELGERLAGPQSVSRSWLGRWLSSVIGVERKERVFNAFARLGVGRRERRKALRLQGLRDARVDASEPHKTGNR